MILVDTSVWIEVFRRTEPLDLTAVVDFDEVVTCLPVIQDVLQGFRDEKAFRLAHEAMHALPVVESPLDVAVFERGRRSLPTRPSGGAHRSLLRRLPDRRVRHQTRLRRAAPRP